MNRLATKFLVTALLTMGLCLPSSIFGQEPGGNVNSGNATPASSGSNVNSNGLPDSPGAAQNANQETAPATIPSPTPDNVKQEPGGAAAAPAAEISGSAVSRPAGSAIAPPKQRQVRSFLIKMGLIAGAGVAIGTVTALSLSSPARVPGSH